MVKKWDFVTFDWSIFKISDITSYRSRWLFLRSSVIFHRLRFWGLGALKWSMALFRRAFTSFMALLKTLVTNSHKIYSISRVRSHFYHFCELYFIFLAPTPPLKSRNTLCQARVNTFNQTLNQKSISLSEAQHPHSPLKLYNPSIYNPIKKVTEYLKGSMSVSVSVFVLYSDTTKRLYLSTD